MANLKKLLVTTLKSEGRSAYIWQLGKFVCVYVSMKVLHISLAFWNGKLCEQMVEKGNVREQVDENGRNCRESQP